MPSLISSLCILHVFYLHLVAAILFLSLLIMVLMMSSESFKEATAAVFWSPKVAAVESGLKGLTSQYWQILQSISSLLNMFVVQSYGALQLTPEITNVLNFYLLFLPHHKNDKIVFLYISIVQSKLYNEPIFRDITPMYDIINIKQYSLFDLYGPLSTEQ